MHIIPTKKVMKYKIIDSIVQFLNAETGNQYFLLLNILNFHLNRIFSSFKSRERTLVSTFDSTLYIFLNEEIAMIRHSMNFS
jgi:hypothetical protein